MSLLASSPNIKHTGAYYTGEHVASFLAGWAIRAPTDTVLDPSFGGGVFLQAAATVIQQLGGRRVQVFGVEMDIPVWSETAARLTGIIPERNLTNSDFFEIDPTPYDAVVGNPPFVRFQSFSGIAREKALERARHQGVALPRLSSSWAPFVIHSCAMLRQGGRLAMVLPMEMWHASYARPVLEYLRKRFRSLEVLTFDERLFADISQDTVLLLANDFGNGDAELRWRNYRSASELPTQSHATTSPESRVLAAEVIASGEQRLIEEFVPEGARRLYRELSAHPRVTRLGELAKVGIGYVSGNNGFFHLSPEQARSRNIPGEYLAQAVCKGRALRGLSFTQHDWDQAAGEGDAAYLFYVPLSAPGAMLPQPVLDYIREGEQTGVHKAYKCRVREPWYAVPHVHASDGFLTYMSGRRPRLVANDGDFVAPNNLHTVRLRAARPGLARRLATAWQSSLARLSAEIEGHAMGGGMLKLEPSEAANVLLALPEKIIRADAASLNEQIRNGEDDAAIDEADRLVLTPLGLSRRECLLLREAAQSMMERRYRGGRT